MGGWLIKSQQLIYLHLSRLTLMRSMCGRLIKLQILISLHLSKAKALPWWNQCVEGSCEIHIVNGIYNGTNKWHRAKDDQNIVFQPLRDGGLIKPCSGGVGWGLIKFCSPGASSDVSAPLYLLITVWTQSWIKKSKKIYKTIHNACVSICNDLILSDNIGLIL